jgi:hypothetical protein
MRSTLLPLTIALIGCELAAQSWTQVVIPPTPPTIQPPSIRRTGAMAYDASTPRLLLFGGLQQSTPVSILNETWSYNGQWTKLNPAGGAPARWGHTMVRDPQNNRILMFGGRAPTISTLANDTWQWTGSAWSQLMTPTAPPVRFRHGMAFDSRRNRTVVFGGRGLVKNLNDTWEFDGVTWTQVLTQTSPPPREDMVMVFDEGLNRTVLFGGYDFDTDTLLGGTWEYDGVNWQQITVAPADTPSPRFRMAAAYDSVRKRIIAHGGWAADGIKTGSWAYAGGRWVQTVNSGGPPLTEVYAGYDRQRQRFVTFGGVGETFSNATWEFTGSNAGIFGLFGQGCPTSVGIAVGSTATPPKINSTLLIDWTNLPQSATGVIVVQGLSNVAWSGLPLPLPLDVLQLFGCTLLGSADFLSVAPAANGMAQSSMTIPNDSSLINVPFYSQILIPDPSAPNGNGGTSRGGRSVFGQ